jgi:hypothetical protein
VQSGLTRRDRLLLLTTLPIFLATFALHVQETARSGLAQLPVLAAWQPDDYPRVGGYRLETDSSGSGLEMGARLIRLGDHDLRHCPGPSTWWEPVTRSSSSTRFQRARSFWTPDATSPTSPV